MIFMWHFLSSTSISRRRHIWLIHPRNISMCSYIGSNHKAYKLVCEVFSVAVKLLANSCMLEIVGGPQPLLFKAFLHSCWCIQNSGIAFKRPNKIQTMKKTLYSGNSNQNGFRKYFPNIQKSSNKTFEGLYGELARIHCMLSLMPSWAQQPSS